MLAPSKQLSSRIYTQTTYLSFGLFCCTCHAVLACMPQPPSLKACDAAEYIWEEIATRVGQIFDDVTRHWQSTGAMDALGSGVSQRIMRNASM